MLRKAGCFADRQDWQAPHNLHQLIYVQSFRCAYKQDLALPQILGIRSPLQPFDDKSPPADFLVLDDLIDDRSEGISTQKESDESRSCARAPGAQLSETLSATIRIVSRLNIKFTVRW